MWCVQRYVANSRAVALTTLSGVLVIGAMQRSSMSACSSSNALTEETPISGSFPYWLRKTKAAARRASQNSTNS